jgi:hypothetical protein
MVQHPLRFAAFVSIAFAATGCAHISTADYQGMTAGAIGCPKDEVVVRNEKNMVTSAADMTWSAECRGHRYICSIAGNAYCKEELAPVASPTAPVAVTPAATVAPVASSPTSAASSPASTTDAIDPQAACRAAEDYDRRASNADSPAKEQLRKMAERKHKECESLNAAPK